VASIRRRVTSAGAARYDVRLRIGERVVTRTFKRRQDAERWAALTEAGATLAAWTGASTKELMARLGHASPRAALRYQHAAASRDREIASRLDAVFAAVRDAQAKSVKVRYPGDRVAPVGGRHSGAG
jgi:hypothetical protein